MLRVLGCITQQHDLRLVAVAVFLCALASWTSVTLLWRARVSEKHLRPLWVLAAALVFGAGVWGTHFVAMLAFRSAVPMGYDVGWTALSIAIAIGVTDFGFLLVFRPRWALSGGAIVGLGISAMHYVGMLAVEGPFHIRWDPLYVIASLCLGAGFGVLAVLAGTRIRDIRGRMLAAASFVGGICAMHFTGMSAATFLPDSTVAFDDAAVLAPGTLAVAVACAALLIVVLGLVSAHLDHHLETRRSGEAARLRAYIAELETARSDLHLALQSAFAASDAKSAFLAAMSHELRTPLNAIIGFSELILSEPLGPVGHPRYAGYVEDINRSGAHLLSLINDVLDLSRLDAGKAELFEEEVSIPHLLDEIRRMMGNEAKRAGVTLSFAPSPGLPKLYADERRLKQIVLNLLANAIKFTPEGGCVSVRTFVSPVGFSIQVSDTGIGIAQADIEKALERFGQVDSRLSRKYEGSGLGLPLARQLVELHGGSLSIESEVGIGTTVTVAFPAQRIVAYRNEAAAYRA